MPQQFFNDVLHQDAELLQQVLLQILNTSFHSIVVTSGDLINPKIIFANPSFCKMTGYTLDELKGQTPKLFQGEKTNPKVISRLMENLHNDQPFHGATTNYRKDGSHYPVEWNITPIKNSQGEVICYISIQKELTALREITSKLKKTNEHFRNFLRDLSEDNASVAASEPATTKTTETHNSERNTMREQKMDNITELLLDNSRLFTAQLRSEENVKMFENGEFFDFSMDDSGVLVEDKQASPAITAAEFAANNITQWINVPELNNILQDMTDTLNNLETGSEEQTVLHHLGDDLQDIASTIFYLDEFSEMATVISELAGIVKISKQTNPEEYLLEIFHELNSDLRNWLESVFVQQSAEDIHYLDSAIISKSKQLMFQFL